MPCARRRRIPSRTPAPPELRRFLYRWLVWHFGSWAVVGALLAPVLPGGVATAIAIPFLAAAPILVLVRRFRARGGAGSAAYPGKATRLLVMRPFWYGQLLAPL